MKLRQLSLAVVIGTTISILSIIGFVNAAASNTPELKFLWIAFYCAGTVALLLRLAYSTERMQLLRASCMTALFSLMAEQMVGFIYFPGLVKDVEALSGEHIRILAALSLAIFSWYFVAALFAAWIARQLRASNNVL